MIDVKSIAKRLIPLLGIGALLVGPFANAWAGSSPDHFDVYTPGYFLDKCEFDGEAHRYYHDYELEKAAGVTPSISPYQGLAPIAILNWTNYNSVVFTVKNAGRYVRSWNFYAHGEQSYQRGSVTNAPKSLTVTFSMLNGLYGSPDSVDIIPQLNMMSYTLAYDANGGIWSAQPETATYIWSNSVTSASSALVSRKGYSFDGWNTASNGTGRVVAPSLKLEPSGGAYLQVGDHLTNVTFYAQWKAKEYPLHLVVGKGINKIYYKVQSSGEAKTLSPEWKSTSSDVDVLVAFDSEWQVYATPKTGYDYTGPTEKSPRKEKMTMDGATFEPSATAGKVTVSFSGNGATSGSVSKQTFTVDEAATLNENQYRRAYHVTYNPNSAGASVSPSSADVEYAFACWNSQADGKGAYTYENQEWVTNPCGLTGKEMMLYAQWSSASASVTLPTPGLAGHSFGGWYAESACKTKVGDAGDVLVPTKDITLYAKWGRDSFTVSFRDGHRDAGDALIVMRSVGYGEAATPPAAPTHDGWRFAGWDSSDYLKVTQNLTVRALYESGNYHVTYNSNYQDGQTERSVESVGCGPEATSDRITLLSAEALDIPFNKKGYRFAGWAWSKNATQPDWLAGAEMAYSVISDYRGSDGRSNLYAVWRPISYLIHFEPNDGEGEMDDQVLTYDRRVLLTKNVFTKFGSVFAGWRDGQGHLYADEDEVKNLTATADATITLTAQWQASTTSERFVRFDPNGATNGTMAIQRFKGTTAQRLTPNAYTKAGYTFAGWAVDAAARRVTYADREKYAFSEKDPTGVTNTLYAVWEPIHYTIIFNTGTNDVTGTIQPITNCTYDTAVTIPHTGFANQNSGGFFGWFMSEGFGGVILSSNVCNLTAIADSCVTLFAQWYDIGELSRAVGLTNAALSSTSWQAVSSGASKHIAVTKTAQGDYSVSTKVVGPGKFTYSWYWDLDTDGGAEFSTKVGDEAVVVSEEGTGKWRTKEVPVKQSGECEVVWTCALGWNAKHNDLRLRDIRWMPDSSEPPEWPTYNLTYANANGMELPASLPLTYAVTNETFAFAPLSDVEGYSFDSWSPSNIVKGTTGNITVTAKWKPVTVTHTVIFDLQGGMRTGGGACEQNVEHGFDAVAPEFTPPAGKKFTGWDKSFTDVMADLTVKALYDTVSYRIDYVNTLGLANPNPLRYTKEESVVFASLGNTAREVFTGWSPSKIEKGTTGDITVTANWVTQQTWTVTFKLGEHISRTGGGALVQKVVDGGKAEAPTIVADEGYVFEGWDTDITCVRADLTAHTKVSAKGCQLSFDGEAESIPYGSTVTRSTFAEKTSGPTNLVCVGWTGSGCVPAVGTSNEVAFQVTGDGSLNWNYVTNWLVSVDATEGGSLTVVDSKGAVVEEDEFWAKNESRFTLEATPEEGWSFLGWRAADGSLAKSKTTTRTLFVTAPVSVCAVFGRNACQVSFVLGEHLTRTGGGALQQTVDQGEAAEAPTVKAAEGYVFDSWDSDFSSVITNMTIRAIVATAKHDVTFVLGDHLTRTGGGALKQTVIHGEAAAAPKVKAESGYRFVGWDRAFASVKEDLTVAAQVEEKPSWTNVIELSRNEEIDPIELDLDALFGERAEEIVSVSVSPLPSGLTYDATEQVISGTPKKSGITVTMVTGTVSARESLSATMTFIVRAEGESSVQVEVPAIEGEIPGKTTGQGVYAEGKKVTVKATANKGYVFSGWYDGASLVSRLASYSFQMPDEDVKWSARFITAAQDAASVQASVNGMSLIADGKLVPAATNVWTGLPLAWPLTVSAESAVKVSVSGLPSGLKFTAKDIVDAKTKTVKVPAMTVYGTPTAGGKTSTVKVTVTTAGKAKIVAILRMTVDALPVELVGTYAGGSTNDPIGSASVTLAKTGKVSGKWISGGKTWTIAAANLSEHDGKTETFTADVTLKNGKLIETCPLTFSVNDLGFGMVISGKDSASPLFFSAIYVPWKTDAELKPLAAELKGLTFTFAEEDVELSGKVGASGVVTVKGVFDIGETKPYTASTKGTLVPVGDDRYELFLYYPPKTAKGFDGYARTLVLHWNDGEFDIIGWD